MALGKGLSSLIPTKTSRKTVHKETGSLDKSSRVWQIPITEIVPNSHQPRKDFSKKSLEDMIGSIEQHGIIQPLLVSEQADGGYELVTGERRLRAAEMAGLTSVPCIVKSTTNQEKLELALIENVQRQDLNSIEEGFAYKRLYEEFGLSHQEIASRIGKSRPYVSNSIRLLGLPDKVKKAVIEKKLNVLRALTLLSLKDQKEQIKTFEKMMEGKATDKDYQRAVAKKGSGSRKGSVRRDANLLAKEQLLEEKLGTRVKIAERANKGTITVHFHSKEELKRIIDLIV